MIKYHKNKYKKNRKVIIKNIFKQSMKNAENLSNSSDETNICEFLDYFLSRDRITNRNKICTKVECDISRSQKLIFFNTICLGHETMGRARGRTCT